MGYSKHPLEKACEHCRAPFLVGQENRRNRFCSQACINTVTTRPGRPPGPLLTLRCRCCRSPFPFRGPVNAAKRKFCSKECQAAAATKQRPLKVCGHCREEFSVTRETRRQRYCSRECATAGRLASRYGRPLAAEQKKERRLSAVRRHREKRRSSELWRLAHCLRSSIWQALRRRRTTLLEVRSRGALRWVGYTPRELYEHVLTRLAGCSWTCRMCGADLHDGYDVDHTVPLSSAETTADVLRLFALSNLDVLCPRCNRYVKRAHVPEEAAA